MIRRKTLIINNDLNHGKSREIKVLNTMLSKIDDIKDNKISKRKGEEEIGQVLVDEYVKPQIEKSKQEESQKETQKE